MRSDTTAPRVGQAGHRHESRRLRVCLKCPELYVPEPEGGWPREVEGPRGWLVDRDVQGAWNVWEATRAWVGGQPRPYYLCWVGKGARRAWEQEVPGKCRRLRNLALQAKERFD